MKTKAISTRGGKWAVALCLALLVCLALLLSPQPARAGNSNNADFLKAVRGVSYTKMEAYVGVPVTVDLEELSREFDKILTAYLNGDINMVYYSWHASLGSPGNFEMSTSDGANFTWTPTVDVLGKDIFFKVFYSADNDNLYSREYTVKNFDAGSLSVDLTNWDETVSSYKSVQGLGDFTARDIFMNTMQAAAEAGQIAPYQMDKDGGDDVTVLDLDKDGKNEVWVTLDSSNPARMLLQLNDNTRIFGEYTLSLSAAARIYCGENGMPYFSTVKFKFPIPITEATVSVKNAVYTGKKLQPAVTVKYAGKTLKLGTDYDLTWFNNVKAGKGTVIVGGLGDFYEQVTKTFTIQKAPNPLTVKTKTVTLKAADLEKKTQKVAASKYISVKKAQGKVTYKKLGGEKKITVNKTTGELTVKKGLKKGTYKIKLQVSASGNSNYKPGSKTVTVTVKVK